MNDSEIKVIVTIKADVDIVFLKHMFENITNLLPTNGHLTFEVDGR